MEQTLFKEKFPLYTTTLSQQYTMESLIEYFQKKIEAHPIATYITLFDHYTHTSSKDEHEIAEGIVDVKNIIFCFGKEIPNGLVPAVRPRSIAITQTQEGFVVTFMEAPNEKLTQTMIEWVEEL